MLSDTRFAEKMANQIWNQSAASLKFHDHIRSHFILQMNQMHQKWSLSNILYVEKKGPDSGYNL